MGGERLAAMTPAALSILMGTFPEAAERNKAIGAWGATVGIGAAAAWIVGGPLVDGPGWHWVFRMNVLVGLAIAALAVGILPESRDRGATRNFEVTGVVSVTAALGAPVYALVALVYVLVDAPTAGWDSARTVGLFALSLALFGAFAAIERRARSPLVPRRIAGSRSLLSANLGLAFTAVSIYRMAFIVSLVDRDG
jgi:MFS family permease